MDMGPRFFDLEDYAANKIFTYDLTRIPELFRIGNCLARIRLLLLVLRINCTNSFDFRMNLEATGVFEESQNRFVRCYLLLAMGVVHSMVIQIAFNSRAKQVTYAHASCIYSAH